MTLNKINSHASFSLCHNFRGMLVNIRIVFVFLVLLLFSTTIKAQSISAQVSTKRVQVGVPFRFAVVISGPASNYNQPYFKDFDVVSGPNQSNNVQIVNGSVTQQIVFSYALVAKREGKLVIPPANCIVGGQLLETQAIEIEVSKGSQGSSQSGSTSEDFFIKTTISKTKFFVGEPITIIQKVYSRHQIINIAPKEYSYDGFFSQILESPTAGVLQMENVGGINYYTLEFTRSLSTASKSGKIQLSPIELKMAIRRPSNKAPRNIWEQLMGAGYEDVPIDVRSKPSNLEVLPLPEAGKPEGFTGGVGEFTTKVEVSRNELKANEAFNLKYTISGRGNIKLIESPKFEIPQDFESYEPKITELGNSKTFDYLIIPRNEGDFEIKGLSFSYFNLSSKSYVLNNVNDIKIHVLAGAPGSEGAQVYTPHSQVKTTENDIRYLKKGNYNLTVSDTEFFNSFWHLLLLAFSPLALAIALFAQRKYISNNSDIVAVRQRKAAGMAKQRLTNAEKMMKAGKKDEFYTEVLLALTNYLSFRLTIPIAELSKERVVEVMTKLSIESAIQEKVVQTLQSGEYAKYAPGALSGDLLQVYNDTVQLVTEIENQLNKKQA